MADLGGYEGVRQAPLPGLPDLPGRPIRRSGGGLCPTVLRRTEADGGVSSHPAPAVRCCLHPTAGCSPSACSSPKAPSCGLHLRSSSATTAAFTMAAAWSWPQESGVARLLFIQYKHSLMLKKETQCTGVVGVRGCKLNVIVYLKMKIMSLISHPHVPNS